MAQDVIITIGVDDNGSPVIRQVTGDLEALNDETEKGGKAGDESAKGSDKASKGFKGMGGAAKLAAAGVAAAAAAAVAAGAAIAGVVAVAVKGVDAYREQEQVNRALEQQFMRAGLAGEELEAKLSSVRGTIGELSKSTNFGDEELNRMAASFVKITGDANVTSEQMGLLADIAHGMGVEGAEAAKIFARAMKGDLPMELSEATALTKEQVEAINAMKDPTERAAAAQAALADQFQGMASDIDPTYRAMKNLDDAQGDFLQKIGQVIVDSGAFAPVIEGMATALNQLEGFVEANKETIQGWIFDGVQTAVEWVIGLMDVLIKMGPVFGSVIPAVQQVGQNFMILIESIKTVARTALAFRAAVVSGIVETLDSVLAGVEAVAKYFGRDLPAGFSETRKSLQGVASDMQDEVVAQLDKAGESADKIRERIAQSAENWGKMDEHTGKFVAMVNVARGAVDGVADRIAEARANLADTTDDARGGGGGGGGDGGGVAASADGADAQAEAEMRLAEEVAAVRIQAANAATEAERVNLETKAQLMELEAQALPPQQHLLALMGIEKTQREELDRIRHEAVLSEIEDAEIQQEIAERRSEAMRKEIELIQQRNAEQVAGLNSILPGLESLAGGLMNVRDLQWGTTEATNAAVSAFSGLADVGGGIASIITKDRKKAAGIEAAFNAASAIGNFAAYAATGFTAQPLLIASIQHGIAAAQFAAVAGGAGGGGGAGGARRGASSGDSGAMRTGGRSDVAAEREAIGQRKQEINITYDFSGSTNLESAPAIERRLSDATRRSEQSKFIAGDVR